ncbi:MAG: RagB/SusD family nutrient uptake outer membrane protein, partial [Bacteroidota bacterium]
MKRINLYILSLFIIGLLQSGCQDFLSVEPVGNVNTEEFYKTLNDLQLGLNATYNVLGTDRYQKSEWLFGEGCGDDAIRTVSMSPSGDEGRLVQFTFTPRNQWIFNRWQINYEGIFRANWVISKAADLPLDQINIFDEQDFLPIIVGQAKFLRALFYFNLVKTYGGVPIKPERIFINGSQDNTIQPRSSIEEVYDYIERDLREALLMVDDRYNTDFFQRGKADKGAVAALLLKVLAYQAEPGVLHPKWQQAMEFGDYLVNQRRLSNREVLNFNVKYDNEFNPETWPELKQRLFLNLNEDLTEEEQLNLNVENTQLYTINFPYEFLWIDEGEFQPGSIFELVHT